MKYSIHDYEVLIKTYTHKRV